MKGAALKVEKADFQIKKHVTLLRSGETCSALRKPGSHSVLHTTASGRHTKETSKPGENVLAVRDKNERGFVTKGRGFVTAAL